jgi:hypothetical protein
MIVALPALFVTGCLRGANVAVGGDVEWPTFRFQKAGFHLNPRLAFPGQLLVYDVDDRRLLWSVSAHFSANDVPRSVRYGAAPAGAFENPPRPSALREGVIYSVTVSGGAYHGGAHFATRGREFLVEQGGGDRPERNLRARLAA